MDRIDPATLDRLPLDRIDKITFYKRDELTTDLICCEVEAHGRTWFFHEEAEGWDLLLAHLERLPGFLRNWYAKVYLPPFASSVTVAHARDGGAEAPIAREAAERLIALGGRNPSAARIGQRLQRALQHRMFEPVVTDPRRGFGQIVRAVFSWIGRRGRGREGRGASSR